MKTSLPSVDREIDLSERFHAVLTDLQGCAGRCASPKRVQMKLCALLAAWEAISLGDGKACYWFDLWQRSCRKRHSGKRGRTLADPVGAPSLSARWRVTEAEKNKAQAAVKNGLRRVFRQTLDHYSLTEQDGRPFAETRGASATLYKAIGGAFKKAHSFASAEGFEVFLLTLIELFEETLGGEESKLFSHAAWRAEIRHRRSGGPPDTRTLADVAPAAIRLQRQNTISEEERIEIVRNMVSAMRHIAKELHVYLENRTHGRD